MTRRREPLALEYGCGYILEIFEDGQEALTCEKCGLRTFDPEHVDRRTCPRCGELDPGATLARDLIRDQWL